MSEENEKSKIDSAESPSACDDLADQQDYVPSAKHRCDQSGDVGTAERKSDQK